MSIDKVLKLLGQQTDKNYLLTEEEHLRYEKLLTNEEKRVITLVEERGVYGFKYDSVMRNICQYINTSLYYNTPIETGTYDNKYPTKKYMFIIPSSILKNIDFFESLTVEITIVDISTTNNIEDTLYGQGSGTYTVTLYDRLTNNDKLPASTFKISGYAVNGKVVEHTVITSLYHEINHAADNFNRLKKYKTSGLFDDYNKHNYGDVINLRDSQDKVEEAIGTIVYRLWIPTERNALVSSLYSDLKSMKSLRSNFVRDLQKSKAYVIYDSIKNTYLPLIKTVDERKIAKYAEILNLPSNVTKTSFVNYFTKKTNFLLGDFFKRLGKTATLYYDENEDIRDDNNKIKKRYAVKKFDI